MLARLLAAAAALAALLVFSTSASAIVVTRTVGTCGTYATIQDAVDASGGGDRVDVCPGTYTEEVTVPSNEPGLTIKAIGSSAATLEPPANPAGNAVLDITAANVRVVGLHVQGPVTTSCPTDKLYAGIRVAASGAIINKVNIADMHDATASELHCITSGIQSIADATIENSTVSDVGLGGGIWLHAAQNSTIRYNTLTQTTSTINGQGTQGIAMDGGNRAAYNNISGYTYGITASANASNSQILHNTVSGAFRGIFAISAGSLNVSSNTLHNNDEGIHVGPISVGSVYRANDATGNLFNSCIDDSSGSGTAGTDNTWLKNNRGGNDSPVGICSHP